MPQRDLKPTGRLVPETGTLAKRLLADKGRPVDVAREEDKRVTALTQAAAEPKTPEEFVGRIGSLWRQAQGQFIEIGRLLMRAKEILPHGSYEAQVEAHLPFSARTAYQLREAARWAIERDRAKLIPMERLPASYTTIYLLSTLDSRLLQEADQAGLIRPDVRRAEIVAFKRKMAQPSQRRLDLEAAREKLRRERARIEAELARIEAELSGEVIEGEAERG